MRILVSILLSLLTISSQAQRWVVEAEPGGYVSWISDSTDSPSIADIYAPKGLTLWYTQNIKADCRIEYEARIVSDGRISDLNCFWMASDPMSQSVLDNIDWRAGRFPYSYSMQMYYLGYGGNNNSTTRFRRYNADRRGIDSLQYRPAILKEYLDSDHLIHGDHWYHICLECQQGHVRYYIDGECLVDYQDPIPLSEGLFGFRTTLSHAQLRHFKVTQLHKVQGTTAFHTRHFTEVPDSDTPYA